MPSDGSKKLHNQKVLMDVGLKSVAIERSYSNFFGSWEKLLIRGSQNKAVLWWIVDLAAGGFLLIEVDSWKRLLEALTLV